MCVCTCEDEEREGVVESDDYIIMLKNYTQMQNEEYGEALALAQQYNLDCDLVYQTQWKTHPISIATIQDYLVRDVS